MSRLNRLLWTGLVLGVAACGDDVTVPPPPITVTVTPDGATISVGQTLQMAASVSGGTGATFVWSSSDPSKATVSGTGLVSAVSAGDVGITATATVGSSTGAGSATVHIQPTTPQLPPTLSIATITNTVPGTGEVPVNVAAVAGQINVTLNLERNGNPISKVSLLLDGVEVQSQSFTPAPVNGSPALVPELIQMSVNTAAFSLTTGVADFPNGLHTLSAQAEVTGSTTGPVAGNSQELTFANVSGIVFLGITNENNNPALGDITFPASAIDPDGFAWTAGHHTLSLLGVSYVAGARIATASIDLFDMDVNVTLAEGAVTTVVYPNEAGEDNSIDDYQTSDSEDGESPDVNTSVLSNGQPGPSIDLNSLAVPLPDVPALPVARVDNVDPDDAPAFVTFPLWANAAFDFQNSIDTPGDDDGVDNVETAFFTGDLPSDACDIEGLEAVALGEDLEESTEITAHDIRAITYDALGNRICEDPGTAGADFTAPEVLTSSGPETGDAFTAAPVGDFAVTVTDNASGFAAEPLIVEMSRLNPDGSTDCVIGSASSCDDTDQTRGLTFDATDGSTDEGYYTTTIEVSDEAGNTVVVEGLPATYLLDGTAPTFAAGGIGLQQLYAGLAAAVFTAPDASDNLDLASIFGTITYPTAVIQEPSASIGTFGAPLEQGPTDAVVTIPSFIRCLNAAGIFTAGGNKPTAIDLNVEDQAGNTATFSGAIPAANVADCGDVATPAQFDAGFSLSASETTVSRDDPDGNTDETSTVLSAVADVVLDETPVPFVRVDFYWVDGGGNLRFIGSDATGALAENTTDRTWTFTVTWDPAAPVPTGGAVSVVAIGVDAQGDAVLTAAVAITINP